MQAPPKRWRKRQPLRPEQIAALQETLGDLQLSPLLLQLLANREIIDVHVLQAAAGEEAGAALRTALRTRVADFLNPAGVKLPSPFTITGMQDAVERLARAVQARETVAVYGDYDADGVTSTVLLTQALRAFGLPVVPHVPHRKREGYGLNTAALDTLADQGVTLVVTVDCGISNIEEVAHGQARGLDLIVTDHHDLPEALPGTIVIDPKMENREDPFAKLAGVGVAHQVVRGLVERLGKPAGLRNNDLLELVAIGTVADIAELVGANRTLVAAGLACLHKSQRPGLVALREVAGLRPELINTHTIGFVLAPRINAAGRLDDARLAIDLLLTSDPGQAAELARKLDAENARRQELTRAVQDAARQRVAALPDDEPIIILRDASWDVGVVGLAAGRLCEEFGRPAIVLADEGEISRGSGRSTKYFDLHELLEECKDLLIHYGGHKLAAGLTLANDNYDAFCEQMRALVESALEDEAQLAGELQADYELPLREATVDTVAALARLEPFGAGNSPPLFVARNLRVVDSKVNGKDGRTLAFQVVATEDPTAPPVRAVAFGQGPAWGPQLVDKPKVDLMFRLEQDDWQGQQRVQLRVEGLRLSKG